MRPGNSGKRYYDKKMAQIKAFRARRQELIDQGLDPDEASKQAFKEITKER